MEERTTIRVAPDARMRCSSAESDGGGPIALVIASLAGGGAERILCGLARGWAREGREVSVITVAGPEVDVYELGPSVRRVALGLLRPSRHAFEALTQGAGRVFALRRALRRLNPTAVVSFMSTTNVLTLLATAGTRIPVVVAERTDPRHEPLARSWNVLRRVLYPRAAAVVVQTGRVAEWAREFCPRVHVIPNPVSRPACTATPGIEHGRKLLVAMGRFGREKGFDLLIDAFARVADDNPDWSLTILGEGDERARLEAHVSRSRLDGRVAMPGWTAEPARRLSEAHAFVLSSRFEGFPNALLEAMACGLPVVAFDCPSGPGEIVTHGRDGLLVAPGDVSGLASALAVLFRSAEHRERMGRNARSIVERLDPEVVLARWNSVLRAVGAA